MKKTITVHQSDFRVPNPSCMVDHTDRYGRSCIYDQWNGTPEYVRKDREIQEDYSVVSAALIGASILLICFIVGSSL